MKKVFIFKQKGEQAIFFLFFLSGFLWNLQAQNIGIGTAVPNLSAKVEISSTNSGLLIPRMTTTQRDVIPSPASSLLIFNTTTNCYKWWDAWGEKWVSMSCGCSVPLPLTPVGLPATNITTFTFDANWNPSSGATTYYLDVAIDNTFSTLVPGYNNLNVGNVTTYNVSGLTCGTTYYYRVRAGNSCGTGKYSDTVAVNLPACSLSCIAIGGSDYDHAGSVTETSDGGLAIAGYTQSYGAGFDDMYIVKLDTKGNLLRTRTVGGINNDYASSIIETSDGGLATIGYTDSYGSGIGDMYVVKLNSFGKISCTIGCQQTIGGTAGNGGTTSSGGTTGTGGTTGNGGTVGSGGTLINVCGP